MDILKKDGETLYEEGMQFKEEKDFDNYIIYITMGANLEHEKCKDELYFIYRNEIHALQDHNNTVKFYRETAEYSYSANYLGHMYKNGTAVEKDLVKAIELYNLAISKGNTLAINNRGFLYKTQKEYDKALQLFQTNYNNSTILNNLADMYINGLGTEKNIEKAIDLYEISSKLGDNNACQWLATLYIKKDTLEYDEKAIQLLEIAIENGFENRIFDLIKLYMKVNKEKIHVIEFFFNIGESQYLADMYEYNVTQIKALRKLYKSEIKKMKQEHIQMRNHILSSPEGPLYFEALEKWKSDCKF